MIPFFDTYRIYESIGVNADMLTTAGSVLNAGTADAAIMNPANNSFMASNAFLEATFRAAHLQPTSVSEISNAESHSFGFTFPSFAFGGKGVSVVFRNVLNINAKNIASGGKTYTYVFDMNEYSAAFGVKEGALGLRGGLSARFYYGTLHYNEMNTVTTNQVINIFENPVGFTFGYGMTFDHLKPFYFGLYIDNIYGMLYLDSIEDIRLSPRFVISAAFVHDAVESYFTYERFWEGYTPHRVAVGTLVRLPYQFSIALGYGFSITKNEHTVSLGLGNTMGLHTIIAGIRITAAHPSFSIADGTVYEITYRMKTGGDSDSDKRRFP